MTESKHLSDDIPVKKKRNLCKNGNYCNNILAVFYYLKSCFYQLRHDIAEILLKLALNTNQSINHVFTNFFLSNFPASDDSR